MATGEATLPAPADGRYWLRVRSIDAFKLEGSDAVKPLVQHLLPAAPSLVTPPPAAAVSGPRTSFAWRGAAGIELDRLHEPEDTCWVSGDRQLLARAVVNLLSNAVKFSSPGCDVQLSCELRDQVVVSVADDGPGIEPERRASLFQRFSRGAHRGSPDPGGAGLGLAFVRVVAEKHGDHAWADDDRQIGAAFHLSVPVNITVSVSTMEPVSATEPVNAAEPASGTKPVQSHAP